MERRGGIKVCLEGRVYFDGRFTTIGSRCRRQKRLDLRSVSIGVGAGFRCVVEVSTVVNKIAKEQEDECGQIFEAFLKEPIPEGMATPDKVICWSCTRWLATRRTVTSLNFDVRG